MTDQAEQSPEGAALDEATEKIQEVLGERLSRLREAQKRAVDWHEKKKIEYLEAEGSLLLVNADVEVAEQVSKAVADLFAKAEPPALSSEDLLLSDEGEKLLNLFGTTPAREQTVRDYPPHAHVGGGGYACQRVLHESDDPEDLLVCGLPADDRKHYESLRPHPFQPNYSFQGSGHKPCKVCQAFENAPLHTQWAAEQRQAEKKQGKKR